MNSHIYPKVGSLQSRVLARLLRSQRLTHIDFQEISRSYRLASYIEQICKKYWPVLSERRTGKTKDPTGRYVSYSTYYLSLETIRQAGERGRDYALKVFEWEHRRIGKEAATPFPIGDTTDRKSLSDITSNPSTKDDKEDSDD